MNSHDAKNTNQKQDIEELFQIIYDKYKPLIIYLVSEKVSNKEDVQDLTQDVFTKIYTKLDTYNSEIAGIKAWIVKITKNLIVDFFRNKAPIIYDNEYIDSCLEQTKVSDEFLFDFMTETLTPIEKDIVVFKSVFDFTHREICEALSVTLDFSKKTYKKAIDKVKKGLAEYEKKYK